MAIACLGWGSLIWSPGKLPVSGGWQSDGPALPVEFARQSQDGRITLVIVDHADPVPVLWTTLNVETLEKARAALGEREGIPEHRWPDLIAHWSAGAHSRYPHAGTVGTWAKNKGRISAAVWTALGPHIGHQDRRPTCDEVVGYLARLNGDTRVRAEEYIRRAPAQIRTRCRAAIEQSLGWTPLTDCEPDNTA